MNLPSRHAAAPRQEYPDGWAPGELPSPRGPSRRTRWLIALGVLSVVVALCIALVVVNSGGPGDAMAGTPTPPVASAGDTGPIELITEDTTCVDWSGVAAAVGNTREAGWDDRDPRVPASSWTPDQRARFTAVGDALRSGADTAVRLAAQTPHRAMRGLYEAFVVYGRAYADSLLNYRAEDDYLAQTSLAASDAITHICAANDSTAASSQVARLTPVAPPTARPIAYTSAAPERFLPQPNRMCSRWAQDKTAFLTRLRPWSALDPRIPVGKLTAAQVQVYADTAKTVTQFAERMEATGRSSANPVLEDFATLGALYFRAYSHAVSLVWPGDHDMARAALAINDLVAAGCSATAT